jgi:hypothetical protein
MRRRGEGRSGSGRNVQDYFLCLLTEFLLVMGIVFVALVIIVIGVLVFDE